MRWEFNQLCKLSEAHPDIVEEAYLCPLPQGQLSEGELDEALESAWK